MAMLNLSSMLKRYWAAMMTIYFIQHPVKTIACITFYLLPSLPNYALREVGHGLSLEHVLSELHKKTFINRMIFTDCYYLCYVPSLHVIFSYRFLFSLLYSLIVYHACDVIFIYVIIIVICPKSQNPTKIVSASSFDITWMPYLERSTFAYRSPHLRYSAKRYQ